MPRRPLVLIAAPFLLAGCSIGIFGPDVLTAEEVAGQTEDALEEQVGVRPDVTCPDDLDAEVGAETRCVATVGAEPTEYGVTVRVQAVDGTRATFDVQVDEEPQG